MRSAESAVMCFSFIVTVFTHFLSFFYVSGGSDAKSDRHSIQQKPCAASDIMTDY